MKTRDPRAISKRIWKKRREIDDLQAELAQSSMLGWDGKPIRISPFPRPYMMEPEIQKRLRIDPDKPELNPFCQCMNALWDSIDWTFNLILTQRVKTDNRGEMWTSAERKIWRWYVLVPGRAEDLYFKCGISKSLAQKVLRAAHNAKIIRMVGRTKTGTAIYAIGFWVRPSDPMRRRAVPFAATTERKRLLRTFNLQP